jgi:hypothetical protein
MISKRVESSQAKKKETTPMTPSQSATTSRVRCQSRLVLSGLDASTETS